MQPPSSRPVKKKGPEEKIGLNLILIFPEKQNDKQILPEFFKVSIYFCFAVADLCYKFDCDWFLLLTINKIGGGG